MTSRAVTTPPNLKEKKTMTTTKTPAQILGVTPQSARTAPAAPPNPAKTTNFLAWKQEITNANAVVGYDATSPIHGKTDVEVLSAMRDRLETMRAAAVGDGSITPTSKLNKELVGSIGELNELLKRKTARTLAGQAYKTHKA